MHVALVALVGIPGNKKSWKTIDEAVVELTECSKF